MSKIRQKAMFCFQSNKVQIKRLKRKIYIIVKSTDILLLEANLGDTLQCMKLSIKNVKTIQHVYIAKKYLKLI